MSPIAVTLSLWWAQRPQPDMSSTASPDARKAPGRIPFWEACTHNPRLTFDNFIVGKANRLAQAGSLAVAERPGVSYNPLFIYGGVGLGKTHLLHAIGNYALAQEKRTLYVAAETFANELINAIRNPTTEEFRARYRTIDVLLRDISSPQQRSYPGRDLSHLMICIARPADRCCRAPVAQKRSRMEDRLRSRFDGA